MRQTLLITLDFPPRVGGVASYYSSLYGLLPSEKVSVLTCPMEGSDDFDRHQEYEIDRSLPCIEDWNKKAALKLLKAIKNTAKFEILQVGNVLPLGTVAMLSGIPYQVFTHGLDILKPNGLKKILVKKILQKAEKIIANSEFTKSVINSFGINPEKIEIIYPSPRISPAHEDIQVTKNIKEKFNLNQEKIILSVGRLVKRKRFDLLVGAFKKINNTFPETKLFIVGDGPEKDNLTLEKNIYLVPKVTEAELAAFYKICNIFIMTPEELSDGDVEGFGIVYLEAGSFGKPVIGTKSGGVPEAIVDNETGLLIEPDNENELIGAITKLLNDEDLANTLGESGKLRVQNEFTPEIQVTKLKRLM